MSATEIAPLGGVVPRARERGGVPEPAAAARSEPLAGRGWTTYLIVATLLTPMSIPAGPGQTAIVDALNLLALVVFAAVVLARRVPVDLPLALPLVMVAAGSLLAMTEALSLPMAVVTVVGDLYLYLWFAMVVALLERRGEFAGVRRAWVVAAVIVALTVISQAARSGGFTGGLFSAKGFRPGGTFYGPNMCADFLVLSVFVALGLWHRLGRLWIVLAVGLIGVALILTRSNGGLISLMAGLLTWGALRAFTVGVPKSAVAGLMALGTAVVLLGLWAIVGWGAGGRVIQRLQHESFLGRVSHSEESRAGIWHHLGETLARAPLGIGPGNSSARTVRIGEAERPNGNLQSKEAHSDYLGYLVERGPLGLAGLLLATWMCFRRVWRSRAARDPALIAALVGALVATTVHSTVIERLHFRHFWMFLALAWALPRARGETAEEPVAERASGVSAELPWPPGGVA